MEIKGFKDDIFSRELSFIELLKRTAKVIYFFKQPISLSFFLFFIPALVFISVVFRYQLINELVNFTDMTFIDWLFYFSQSLVQQIYFAGSILFVIAFFEKKIFQTSLMMNKIFSRLLPFIFTYVFQFSLISAGFMAFIFPGLLIAVFLSFSLFLIYSENLWGFESFKESARTVKAYWFKVMFYFLILLGIEFLISYGVNYLMKSIVFFRLELKFFVESIISLMLFFFPAVFFAVLFYNLRQQIEPKEKEEEPAVD